MKFPKQSFFLLALGIAASSLLIAQDEPKSTNPPAEGRRGKAGQRGPGPEGQGRGQLMNPAARVAELDRTLALTAEQKTKLTDIFTRSRDEMQALRGGDGDRQANREKLQQAMQSARDEVQGVLTDEQKKKFEEIDRPGRGRPGAERQRPGQGKRKKNV